MRRMQQNNRTPSQESQRGRSSSTALQRDLQALIQSLQARAHTINNKRRARDTRVYWIAQGRQQTVRRVSTWLRAIKVTHVVSYPLYLALQEYLDCLNKWRIDAEEERSAARPGNRFPIEQWKAEGEADELSRITRALARIVQAHTPDSVCHALSLDGTHLVPLRDESHERSLTHEAHIDPFSSHASAESVPAKHTMVGGETHQESALVPVRLERPVPLLGPFPSLPDGGKASQQRLLLTLEDALAHHARVLVNVKHGTEETMDLLLMFLDRVLQYTSLERILVFAGSVQLLPHLRQRYRTWVSRENGVPLSEYYLTQYTPTAPLAPDTRICFSSIREMQLLTRSLYEEDVVLSRQTFDLIIVYELASLTAPWQQVLAYFDAPYAVGIGSQADQTVAHAFDSHLITPESEY